MTLARHRVDPGARAGGEHDGRQRPATTCSGSVSALGAAGRSMSAIVLSQRAAGRRQRDDLIALPSAWVIGRIAARAT